MVATGRAANIEDSASRRRRSRPIAGSSRSTVGCGRRSPTSTIGTPCGGLWLAHTAGDEGITAAHTIAGDPDVDDFDYNAQPWATHRRPEVASIGLTEEQVKAAGTPYKVGKVRSRHRQGDHRRRVRGLAQVISNPETEDTLGVHVVGLHATDLIAEASLVFVRST